MMIFLDNNEPSEISGPWTVAGQLRFFCNNVELRTYQQILQLFVELKEAKPDTAHQPGGDNYHNNYYCVTFYA